MSKTVIAVFDSISQARKAVQALSETGIGSGRIRVHTGEEFVARAHEPGTEGARQAVARFLADIGARGENRETAAPLFADDAVVVLEAADDRADESAAVLDRYGAIDVDERREGTATSAIERTPPHRETLERYDDVDERSIVAGGPLARAPEATSRRARVYGGH